MGCGSCPINKRCRDVSKVPVLVTFLADQYADNWGRIVKVFQKGDTTKGMARVFQGTAYCITAKSRRYPEYHDYIQLNNINVEPGNLVLRGFSVKRRLHDANKRVDRRG
jgi:hypothetical protein